MLGSPQLKPLVKGFEATRLKLDDTLGHLQSSAVSLAEAGLIDDPVSPQLPHPHSLEVTSTAFLIVIPT